MAVCAFTAAAAAMLAAAAFMAAALAAANMASWSKQWAALQHLHTVASSKRDVLNTFESLRWISKEMFCWKMKRKRGEWGGAAWPFSGTFLRTLFFGRKLKKNDTFFPSFQQAYCGSFRSLVGNPQVVVSWKRTISIGNYIFQTIIFRFFVIFAGVVLPKRNTSFFAGWFLELILLI